MRPDHLQIIIFDTDLIFVVKINKGEKKTFPRYVNITTKQTKLEQMSDQLLHKFSNIKLSMIMLLLRLGEIISKHINIIICILYLLSCA